MDEDLFNLIVDEIDRNDERIGVLRLQVVGLAWVVVVACAGFIVVGISVLV